MPAEITVHVAIVEGPVPARAGTDAAQPTPLAQSGVGAVVVFEGIVRAVESGSVIAGLDYEAYQPMAERELARLARAAAAEHGLLGFSVVHSRGLVPAGGCSVRVEAYGAHRAEALRAVGAFLDRMKRDVPIWKHAVSA